MDDEQTDHTNLTLEQAFRVVRRRFPWILICLVVVGAAAFVYSKRETAEYTATASLTFSDNSLSQQIAGLSSGSSSSLLTQQQSNLELVKVGNMSASTASLLGHGLTAEKVSGSVSVSGKGETDTVDVSATSGSPVLAAAIANTYASQFVKEQQSANHHFFQSALALVKKQLAALSPAQRYGTDGLDLQDRAQSLGLLAELGYNNAQLSQEASVPSSPSSPKTKRNTIVGAAVGLLLGLAIAFLLERFDHRVREAEELEVIYSLPLLGSVPKSGALASGSGTLPPAEAEAFSLIRAHLRFFNVDRVVRALIIASPAPGDGKTTTARHLAAAAARSGSRVLLLEVDLRHPTLAHQLGLQPSHGLAGVLIGTISLNDATQSVAVEAPPGEGTAGRTFDVLVAGSILPPNPGELLESKAMDMVLARSKSSYDMVVIDTPPLTAVSDAFPLLTKVDGVVIVGWVGRSRRDAAEQLQQVLATSNVPLLGVIANGANSNELSSYAEPGGDKTASTIAPVNGVTSSEELAPSARS